jgi:hypothetical protein
MNRQPQNRAMDFEDNNGVNEGYKTKIMCSETFNVGDTSFSSKNIFASAKCYEKIYQ